MRKVISGRTTSYFDTKSKWVRSRKRLPKKNGEYLCKTCDGDLHIYEYCKESIFDKWIDKRNGHCIPWNIVSYWSVIPEFLLVRLSKVTD